VAVIKYTIKTPVYYFIQVRYISEKFSVSQVSDSNSTLLFGPIRSSSVPYSFANSGIVLSKYATSEQLVGPLILFITHITGSL
jgi:hypothetical protein